MSADFPSLPLVLEDDNTTLLDRNLSHLVYAFDGNSSIQGSGWIPVLLVNNDTNCSGSRDTEVERVIRVTHGLGITSMSLVGVILNILNLVVLSNGQLKESSYTYLTGLAVADGGTLLMFLINGVGRGFYPTLSAWRVFEVYVYFPCGFATSTAGALITVAVSAERFVFLSRPLKAKLWCTQRVARIVTALCWTSSVALNIPRFFVFKVDHTLGELVYTDFGTSHAYLSLSWFQFLFVSVGCGIALIILNILLLRGIHKTNQRRLAMLHKRSSQQGLDDVRLTRTLISIVFVFLMGEIPSALTSRGLVLFLSGNNPCTVETPTFKIASLIATILIVLQLSLNFVVYCVCNRRFWAVFRQTLCRQEMPGGRPDTREAMDGVTCHNNNPSCEMSSFHEHSKTHNNHTRILNGYSQDSIDTALLNNTA